MRFGVSGFRGSVAGQGVCNSSALATSKQPCSSSLSYAPGSCEGSNNRKKRLEKRQVLKNMYLANGGLRDGGLSKSEDI